MANTTAPRGAAALARERLTQSGLDPADASALGLEPLEAHQVARLSDSFHPLPALKLPYFDPINPKQPLSVAPGWPPFYRLRYLKTPPGFAALTKKKAPRYVQPPESGVAAYFPRTQDWSEILPDPDRPLIITEGELKAAKACKEGFPTIGLGGVFNFRSAQFGHLLLPELAAIEWVRRFVYLVFDSDVRTNPQVAKAMNELAEALARRGALVQAVPLPDVREDGKTGLDDFLVLRSPEELGQLMRDRGQPLTLASTLFKMNEEVIYVHSPGLVLVKETGQKLSADAFKNHAFATQDHAELVTKPDGTVSLKPVSAAASWLTWPLRAEAGALTYLPGAEPFLEGETPRQSRWNVWPGWGVEPARGDASPFLKLVDFVFTDADPEAKRWFLRWCAYPLQHPGTKLFTSCVVFGIEHGTGKSQIAYTLGRIYGKNFTEIKQKDLHANHNEWAENRQFVLADDITGSTKREDADILKKLVTQQEMRINPKFIPAYTVPDCINYYFTSNQPDAFFLEDHDRRFFIHEVTVAPLSQSFYAEYHAWLQAGGAAHVFDYLLRLDLADFNPAAPALRTQAKELMTQDVKSDLGLWVHQLKRDPEAVLKLGEIPVPGDLFTTAQLLQLYDPLGRTGTTANGLGRELRRAGIPLFRRGTPIRTDDGLARYYVLRNPARWARATPDQARAHLDALGGAARPKKKEAKF